MRLLFILCLASIIALQSCNKPSKALRNDSGKLEVLFLGHDSEHHNSTLFMPMLASQLSLEGIGFTYTSNLNDINPTNLANYDALMIYANHDSITNEQEKALLDYVEKGGGLIPVHSASWCFRNSPKYIELVGAQFLKHKTDTFTTEIVKKDHAITQSLQPFSTWDETYEHDKFAKDITVLMERVEGDKREPWTWVKEFGKGRVFYTAYGHDERTWNNPGFHQLMKEGILWAVGDAAKQKWEPYRKQLPTLAYRDAEGIPNYEKRSPGPRYQDPLSPEESAKLIQVPIGFDLELFASEPNIINPIAMEWDEKGRLWVIETVDYPNTVLEDKSTGDDRIKICEDTDGDGKADKFTVFADKLNIATSMVFSNGGIIISQAPQFLFLKDTDGDDKADVRKTIIDGWGVFDTHAGPSNLSYGIDNQIWGVVGYSGFEGVIAGESRKFSQGVYRFKPDVSSFEFMTNTSNNTWGLGFTENNDVFASTANNTHSVFMGIANRGLRGTESINLSGSSKIDGHYAMHAITDKVRQVDVFGGFTAAAGHRFYTARNYPENFWNKVAFVCEPTGHLVHMARIEKNGAGFIEKDGWNLFSSSDEWVAPVEAKVGPDGAVWVLDWYNFIIQHNPTPTPERGGFDGANGKGNAYENPLRDKSHGRVWRVVSRQAKEVKRLSLSKENAGQLVETLQNDNMLWRTTAQRLLVERGNLDVLPDLYDIVQASVNETENFGTIHALWTMDGLGAITKDDKAQKIIESALKHKTPGARKAAIQIMSKSGWTEEIINQNNLLNDADPGVRMAAITSLGDVATSESLGKALYQLSLEETIKKDDWLSVAVYVAAHQHRKGFLDAFLADNPNYGKKQEQEQSNREATAYDASAWKEMKLPQLIENAGLDIDGIIWFRKTFELTASASGKAKILLGPIDDSDVTYINGTKVGSIQKKYAADRVYEFDAKLLKAGKNTIVVRVEDTGGGGGIYGKPDVLYLEAGSTKVSLAGNWQYDVEKTYGSKARGMFEGTTIAQLFADNNLNKVETAESTTFTAGAIVIKLKVIKNEMKYDLKAFRVEAGKPVEIIFENPDFMQHNLVLGQIGSLEKIGEAANKLAADPKGSEKQYVPDIPEVLFATKLVNPQQTVTLKFTAPAKPGDYPFICTFPGHWSIMNGVMKVEAAKSL